jgi:two-component system, NarL family, sensor kinase
MEKSEIIVIIFFTSAILVLVCTFLLLVLIWHRRKTNKYIAESQIMQEQYQKQLLVAKLEIQEQTLNNISGELHDNVGQILSLATIQLNILEVSRGLDRNDLQDIRESVGNAIGVLRDIAKSLSTERIRGFNLAACIEEEINRIRRSGILNGILTIEGTEQPFDDEKKIILFRIIQECIQNILKHSGAREVGILMNYETIGLFVKVTDNGRGFSVDDAFYKRPGLGLQNILKRAELVGGKADFSSVPGGGTIVNIYIPYE